MADLLSGCCHVVASSSLCSAPDCACRFEVFYSPRICTPARLSLHVAPRTTAISKLGGNRIGQTRLNLSLPYTGTADKQYAMFFFPFFILSF